MTILKKEKKGNLTIYTVGKDYDDAKMEKKMNTFISSIIHLLIFSSKILIYNGQETNV